jgi:hypothetical protein
LVDGFAGFGKEAKALSGRGCGKFLNRDQEGDIGAWLLLEDREVVKLGELFGRIFLRVHPVRHKYAPSLRWMI